MRTAPRAGCQTPHGLPVKTVLQDGRPQAIGRIAPSVPWDLYDLSSCNVENVEQVRSRMRHNQHVQRAQLAVPQPSTTRLVKRVQAPRTPASVLSVQNAAIRMSSMLIAPHAQRVRQARVPTKTGRSASAVWARRSRRSGSARTALRRTSWTVLIRAAARVHLARSRTSIAQPAWRVRALHTLALGKTV